MSTQVSKFTFDRGSTISDDLGLAILKNFSPSAILGKPHDSAPEPHGESVSRIGSHHKLIFNIL